MPSTYLITGCSSGIGLELVKQLAARAEKIFATVRSKIASATGNDEISQVVGDVTVIEGVDVTNDDVGTVLANSALKDVTIDVVVHNAGSLNGTRDIKGAGEMFEDQKIHKVSPARMMAAFNVNCLGVLRVQQAVNGQMKSPGGKICILSTGMASIADNGSGGIHAYRCSKAAVNMLGKGIAVDMKKDGKGIAVVNVAPGMVQTGFGPGAEMMKNMGAMSVGVSCKGLIKVFDDLTMENTGKYMCVYKDKDPEEFPSGW